ncbi:hypothetical protein L914_19117 [Phytophthora nicotianae]|uniref:Uncharacterized protein n=2 Tax=Phytophthora nicotianae TaxID=4792 RepID=W2MBJ6_PHYNI|nr:hypothetical protein L914_19117 [Phytophthora nicotianae]ETO62203.1 hypothetical protein F444_19867 [Phytophthora nicotianae P1976]
MDVAKHVVGTGEIDMMYAVSGIAALASEAVAADAVMGRSLGNGLVVHDSAVSATVVSAKLAFRVVVSGSVVSLDLQSCPVPVVTVIYDPRRCLE